MLKVIWAVTERGHKQADKAVRFQTLDNTTSFWNEKSATWLSDVGGKKNHCNFMKTITRQPCLKTGERKLNYEIHLMNHRACISTLK